MFDSWALWKGIEYFSKVFKPETKMYTYNIKVIHEYIFNNNQSEVLFSNCIHSWFSNLVILIDLEDIYTREVSH